MDTNGEDSMIKSYRLIIPIALTFVLIYSLFIFASASARTADYQKIDLVENGSNDSLETDQVLTLGFAGPLSGPDDYIGWIEVNAVQLAISQTNAAGGVEIGGEMYEVALVTADDQCDADLADEAADNLLLAGAVAVIGHSCSSASMVGQAIYHAADVAMISPSSTNPLVTQQGYTTTFRVVPHDGVPPSLLATHFRSTIGLSTSALVETASAPWGVLAGDAYEDTFTALGGTITSRRFAADPGDFTTILNAINAENPDAIIFLDDDPARAGLFSLVAHGLGMGDVIMAWNTWDNDGSKLASYIQAAGPLAAENDYAAMQYRLFQDMPGWESFYSDYQNAGFSNEPNPWLYSAFAYDATGIVLEAIDRADSTDPAVIRNEIAQMVNYPGVVGTYQGFDADGDIIPRWAWLEKFENGHWDFPDSQTIKIGFGGRISGPYSSIGWQEANSVQLAIDQVNLSGGVSLGGITYTLELVAVDDGINPAAGELIASGVVAVVGHAWSSSSMAFLPTYNAAGIPIISPSNTHPQVSQLGYDNYFRNVTHDGSPPSLLAEYFRNWLGITNTVIVETSGLMPGDYYSQTFSEMGGTILSRHVVNSTDEFTATLTAILAENPDSIANLFYADFDSPQAGGLFSKIAENVGLTDVTIGWNSFSNSDDDLVAYANAAESAADGDYASMQFHPFEDMPGWNQFLADYLAATFPNMQDDPGLFGVYAYDAANILIAALERADSEDPSAIRDELAATQGFHGVAGTYLGFDEYGDIIPQVTWLEHNTAGQWLNLHPTRTHLPLLRR